MAPQNQQQKPKEKEYHLNFLAPFNQPEPTEHLNKNKKKYSIFWLPEPTEHDRTPQQEAKAKPP